MQIAFGRVRRKTSPANAVVPTVPHQRGSTILLTVPPLQRTGHVSVDRDLVAISGMR